MTPPASDAVPRIWSYQILDGIRAEIVWDAPFVWPDDTLLPLPESKLTGPSTLSYKLVRLPSGYCLSRNGKALESAVSPAELLLALEEDVLDCCVAQTPWPLLHAAVVQDGERVLLLPAQSGNGKTTLTTYLLAYGWTYRADELVAIQEGGRLLPLRTSLHLKTQSPALSLASQVGLHLLGPLAGGTIWLGRPTRQAGIHESLVGQRVGLCLLQFQRGSSHHVRNLPKREALVQLVDHVVNGERVRLKGIEALVDVLNHAEFCATMVYSDPAHACQALVNLWN
jgi:hypothetical protein